MTNNNSKLKTLMNRLLLCTLLLVSCAKSPMVSYQTPIMGAFDPIIVTDADTIARQLHPGKCKYVPETYIINKEYIAYQDCDTIRRLVTADLASFKREGGFAIDKNGVYYKGNLICTDTIGFKILTYKHNHDYLWRTDKKIFFGKEELSLADPATFEPIGEAWGSYFKDKNNLYYYDQKVEGADISSLNMERRFFEDFICDKNHIYYQGKPLMYQGESVEQLSGLLFKTINEVLQADFSDEEEVIFTPITGDFDIPTLRGLSFNFMIDKHHLYLVEESSYCQMPTTKLDLSKVKAYERYIYDGRYLYRGEQKVREYDPATFGIFQCSYDLYQYDKHGIYAWEKKLPFKIKRTPVYGKNLFSVGDYIIYENQLYITKEYSLWHDPYVKGLTQEQVQLLKQGKHVHRSHQGKVLFVQESYDSEYYKADNQLYYIEKPAQGVDMATFDPYFAPNFYRDKNHVYLCQGGVHVVKGYDNSTLQPVFGDFLMDKDYLYYKTQRLFKSKEVSLLAIYQGAAYEHKLPDFYLFKNAEGYWSVCPEKMTEYEFDDKGDFYYYTQYFVNVEFLGTEFKEIRQSKD